MKRLIALAALLVPLWGCAPAEGPANANANANLNANAGATPELSAAAPVSEAAITDQEKQVWDALKRKDHAAVGQMLAEDFIFPSARGVLDKKGALDDVKTFNPTDVTFSDWKVVPIDKDAAVVVYTTTVQGTGDGRPLPNTPVRNSSVWINRGGKWVAIFHQETDVDEAEAKRMADAAKAAPKPPPPANANTSASPAGDAAVEAADPIAKEKQVWEEIKRGNWDAFASDLADEQIEVEASGIYNKAASIANVKTFDFSKVSVSDFKQTRIDDDAAIVTYVATDAGRKESSRASTVWVKRGAKWYALLHQSTPIKPAPPR